MSHSSYSSQLLPMWDNMVLMMSRGSSSTTVDVVTNEIESVAVLIGLLLANRVSSIPNCNDCWLVGHEMDLMTILSPR